MNKPFICIAGRNTIAVRSLKYLIEEFDYEKEKLLAIVSSNDDGIDKYQLSFKKYVLENSIETISLQEAYRIENLIFISLQYDVILRPNKFLSAELFNIHFSLLPEYKGMYTSALPILHGRNKSGVTLHLIDDGIDTGEIIDQQTVNINQDDTSKDLYEKYTDFGVILFKKNLNSLINKKYIATKQDSLMSSYFSKKSIDYNNLIIDLNKTAFQIKNQIRAFTYEGLQFPKIFNIEIKKAIIIDEKSKGKAGTIIEDKKDFLIINTVDFQLKLIKK
ncbi:MAG: hypothetical protein JXL97_20170 [Bacteroidales bacterium]|nr:hypothetical protein [Bacteroidales bacterium]